MTSTNRRLISLMLSLLLVMSGPVLAVSQMPADEAGSAMADCGSMTMNQNLSTELGPKGQSGCFEVADMVCLGSGSLNSCAVTLATLVSGFQGFSPLLAQPAFLGYASHYQAPYLAAITPPPQFHS